MTSIQVLPEDAIAASRSLALLQRKHGKGRALELAVARIRVDAAYLAKWTGPSAAAHMLAEEAHRVVAEAATELAAPPETARAPKGRQSAERGKRRRLVTIGRAAAWATGILTGFALGLGVSGWALD